MTASPLRSFLRFLHVEGLVTVDLAAAVPPFAFRRQSGLPEPLPPQQVQALIGACDPSGPVGRRDLAVIACLLRLGLRCGEVAALRLDDLDWADGTITVHGKGNRVDMMPLPVDVGQALVDYLRDGRPRTSERVVFLTAVAPISALGNNSISCIVGRAARPRGWGRFTPTGCGTPPPRPLSTRGPRWSRWLTCCVTPAPRRRRCTPRPT